MSTVSLIVAVLLQRKKNYYKFLWSSGKAKDFCLILIFSFFRGTFCGLLELGISLCLLNTFQAKIIAIMFVMFIAIEFRTKVLISYCIIWFHKITGVYSIFICWSLGFINFIRSSWSIDVSLSLWSCFSHLKASICSCGVSIFQCCAFREIFGFFVRRSSSVTVSEEISASLSES